MSETKENNEISNEGRIKNLEVKVDKVEDLLTMNICFTIIGCMVFMIAQAFQITWSFSQNEVEIGNFIFIGLFVIYGILNVIILSKKNQDAPNQSIKKEPISQKEPSL